MAGLHKVFGGQGDIGLPIEEKIGTARTSHEIPPMSRTDLSAHGSSRPVARPWTEKTEDEGARNNPAWSASSAGWRFRTV